MLILLVSDIHVNRGNNSNDLLLGEALYNSVSKLTSVDFTYFGLRLPE